MTFYSINPATGEEFQSIPEWSDDELEVALQQSADATASWAGLALFERCRLTLALADALRSEKETLATLITREMGKLYTESLAEVDKCISGCKYYADKASDFLADEVIETDASRSLVAYQPEGTVLAVMPWNFPLWQVFRFAVPALIAGNTGVLKHASNVSQCALAIEQLFIAAGYPAGVFRTLMIGSSRVRKIIEDPRIHAVTLTGSEKAGREVASIAGTNIKKSVLELGGSDAFVVLEDADLIHTIKNAVISRYLNGGQSCIAAKRFIVVDAIADTFVAGFKQAAEMLVTGDPMDPATTLAPMARKDLREELHRQVSDSIAAGAVALTGCEMPDGQGYFYPPSILDHAKPGMPAWDEEFFGPVAIVIRAKDERDALRIANDTRFGLGGSIWTKDSERGERFARKMQTGAVFVNGFVKSDPRLPFGGVRDSGYGRELSHHGLHEFVNIKTLWIS